MKKNRNSAKWILLVVLAVMLVISTCACKREVEPGKRGTLTNDDTTVKETLVPTGGVNTIAVITGVDMAEGTVSAQMYAVEYYSDSEVSKNATLYSRVKGFTKQGDIVTYKVNPETEFYFGDIFNYDGLGGFVNKDVTFGYFAENAVKAFPDGTPIYFRLTADNDTLKRATLWNEYYRQG